MRELTSYFKTMILFAGLTALVMGVCYFIGGRSALLIGFLISAVMNIAAYWFSDKMVLASTGAQPIERSQAPEIYKDIEELSHKMGIPMPKVYMTNDMQPNAFATGRDPSHGIVCVTKGITQALSKDELRGVLAHELGHIKNYDILISSVAAVFAGAIASIGDMIFWLGLGGNNDDEDRGPAGIIGTVVMLIVAPIAAMLIQFAISRTREYEADATAAEYTKDPEALAHALIKIEQIAHAHPMQANPAYASLFIQNPFNTRGIMELFSTHPVTEKRVAKLMRLK